MGNQTSRGANKYKVATKRGRLYLEWFKTLKAYHESEIAKHQYKIVKAQNKLQERLRLEP